MPVLYRTELQGSRFKSVPWRSSEGIVGCAVVVAVFPSTVGVHCEVTVFDITVTVQEQCCPFGGIFIVK